jgi:hypothetical protein
MTRDRTDLRQHLGEQPVPLGIVPINGGHTLSVLVRRGDEQSGWRDEWTFVGEGAESIPRGYGPLPRASLGARSNVFVGDFAKPE